MRRQKDITVAYAIQPISLNYSETKKLTDCSKLKKDASWFARMLWRILEKMKALDPYSETVRTWTYSKPQRQNLMEAIQLATYEFNALYNRDAVLVIGGKDFAELTGSPAFCSMMRFDTGDFYYEDVDGFTKRILGVPVHVVPNMKGFAVIPKHIVVKRKEGR